MAVSASDPNNSAIREDIHTSSGGMVVQIEDQSLVRPESGREGSQMPPCSELDQAFNLAKVFHTVKVGAP